MSKSNQILWISFWQKFLKVFRDLLSFLFANFLDMEHLFVVISVSCSLTIRRFLFRVALSFKVFVYPWEVHLNLIPMGKSSPEWHDTLDFQMKFTLKAERGIPPKGTADPEPDSLRESELEQESEFNSEPESKSASFPEWISPSISSDSAEEFCGYSPQEWISAEGSGGTGFLFDGGIPLCSVKDMPEFYEVGVATGKFLWSMCRALHL